MSAPQQHDLDRLAPALARLLADWWQRRAGETPLLPEASAVGQFGIASVRERQEEAPAPTGAGEIHPERETRKEPIS